MPSLETKSRFIFNFGARLGYKTLPMWWWPNSLPNRDGLVQKCSISIANALKTLQSCSKPSIYASSGLNESNKYHTEMRVDMMASPNGNIFRVTSPLCGELTGHRWIPLTKASDAELWCYLWSASWINSWVNNREAGDLRRHGAHYDVIVMDHILWQWSRVNSDINTNSYDRHVASASKLEIRSTNPAHRNSLFR